MPLTLRDGPPGLLRATGFVSVFMKCRTQHLESDMDLPGRRLPATSMSANPGYCPNSSPTEEVPLARKPLHVSLRAAGEAIPPFFKTWTAERWDCHAPVGRSQ